MDISSTNSSLIAEGIDYFRATDFPVAVCMEGKRFPHLAEQPPDLTGIEHKHDFWEIVVITRGQGMHFLGDHSFPVSAGDVFVLQGRQKHYFTKQDDLELINILYDPDRLPLPENELRKLPGYCALFMLEPTHRLQHRFASRLHLKRIPLAQIEQIVDKIEDACDDMKAGWEVSALTALQELMISLSLNYADSDTMEANALLRVGNVIGVLENEYMTPWKLDELAKMAHMSRGNLIRVFSDATGQTPIEYLIRIRIQRSMELLRNTDLPITEVALRIGFNDSNYFSRTFRDALNQSPRQFRRQHRK